MSGDISRRKLFRVATAAGTVGAVSALPLSGTGFAQEASAPAPHGGRPLVPAAEKPHYLFFNLLEAAFIEAAAARLIPNEDGTPGAIEAGVPVYIDRQLAGAYGGGAMMYMQGPWREGTRSQGYQLPFTPAQVYRLGMRALAKHVASVHDGATFDILPAASQDRILHDMQTGAIELEPVPSAVFFSTLLANAVEGFFVDPIYGGNRDMAGWKLVGFPGAHASYAEWVDRHGVKFDRPPISIADHGHDHG